MDGEESGPSENRQFEVGISRVPDHVDDRVALSGGSKALQGYAERGPSCNSSVPSMLVFLSNTPLFSRLVLLSAVH